MGFVPVGHDASILNAVSMEIMQEPPPVDGFPVSPGIQSPAFDQMAAQIGISASQLYGPRQSGDNVQIPFQFPPVIKNDTKSANWSTGQADKAFYEPVAVIWQGATPRKITLNTKYIITGSAPFTVDGIAAITHLIKSYFYRTLIDVVQESKVPVVKLKLYESVPQSGEASTWRVESVNITHDGAFITTGGKIFPLITEVTWELAMITRVGLGLQIDSSLPKQPKKEWY